MSHSATTQTSTGLDAFLSGLDADSIASVADEEVRQQLRRLCQTSSYFLAKSVLGYDLLVPRLHGPMCAFVDHPPSRFTLLMAFRGSYKSTIGTVTRTVKLLLGERPRDILIFSEAAAMAESWSREARRAFEGGNRLMEWLFPELQSQQSKSAKWGDSHWQLPNGSSVRAAGIDTQLMGAHVDDLIMDDIFSDPKGEKTPEFAERITNFVKMSAPLLKNPATGFRYLTGVPWWVEGDAYAVFRRRLPRKHQFLMPLLRPDGTCVWPEAFPEDTINELRLDPFVFASQYLLNPVSQETAVFKKGALSFYDERPPERLYKKLMTVDPAFSAERRAHRTAMAIALVDAKGTTWIEHAEATKLDGHQTKRWILEQLRKHLPDFCGIEANGPQKLLFEEIRHEVNRYPFDHPIRKVSLVPLKPARDKISRWNRLATACTSGTARIKRSLSELISEMYRVTGAKHEANDLTDAVAHLVSEELRNKKPWRFTETDDWWLPAALREDRRNDIHRSAMAM